MPETGSEGISSDGVRGVRTRTYAPVSPTLLNVTVNVCWPTEGKDIESDSHRAGHNFRPTRSELLMTSLPPPHHSAEYETLPGLRQNLRALDTTNPLSVLRCQRVWLNVAGPRVTRPFLKVGNR